MKTFTTIHETKNWLLKTKKTIGFVPTMGALHRGHLSLIEKAKRDNDIVIASVFVNPLQFNDKRDLEKYPRTLAFDSDKLKQANCDALFTPSIEEIYPPNQTESILALNLGLLDKVMEGQFRPGHFMGVCKVVKKLFDIISPSKAYFGEKDYQQLTIIKYMVNILGIPVNIFPVPTVREPDGLAMSSRNVLLSTEERENAPLIYQTLLESKKTFYTTANEIKAWVEKRINNNPCLKLEYFEIVDSHTLMPINNLNRTDEYRACISVKANTVRLIDNIPFRLE